MSELFIYYSNVSSSVSSSFMNSPIFYQTILSGFISLLVSVAVALASYYLKKFLDKRGEISIYTKIINRPNIRGWGFENRNGDFYSLFIPLKVEVINNKNIDYVLRDFSLLIDNEKTRSLCGSSRCSLAQPRATVVLMAKVLYLLERYLFRRSP